MEPAVVVRIHPGQLMLPHVPHPLRLRGPMLALGYLLVFSSVLVGQELPQDSIELHELAREAQRAFETTHRALLPEGVDQIGDRCDEYLGRLCLSIGDLGWTPSDEDSRIGSARVHLLEVLEEVGSLIPGDQWVLGQRIRYLGDLGWWEEAEGLARRCQVGVPWWCDGLLGYVLHRGGRTVEALEAFSKALLAMPSDRAREWADPYPILEAPAGRWVRDPGGLSPSEAVARFWTLSDPLFLTPGNERLSEHYARRFALALYRDTELTLGLPWGKGFDELLVRYGFVAGWDQIPSRSGRFGTRDVLEHRHPESRGLLPPLEALEDPTGLPEGVWTPRNDRPLTTSAPVLAPLIAQGQAQTAVLRRGGNLLILGAYGTPVDSVLQIRRTSRRQSAGPEEPFLGDEGLSRRPPWEPSVDGFSADTLAGMYLLADTGRWAPLAAFGYGGEGVIQLTAPPGAYLVSVEQWCPKDRWGARTRHGVRGDDIPPDVPHLSDLLLLDAEEALPPSLTDAIPRLRPSSELPSGARMTVAWEVYGLNRSGGALTFRLSLVEEGGSLIRRALKKIRLFRKAPVLSLSWDEESPAVGGPLFRAVDVELPSLKSGRYVLRLEMDIPFRSTVVTNRRISVS